MNSKPLLSICIPTYNRAAYLRECLTSLQIDGSWDQIEVIVSDNASTDQTLSVLEDFRDVLPLRWIVQPRNLGADRNFDAVVAEARGEYCWLLGDDDVVIKKSLDAIKHELQSSKPLVLQLGYIQGSSKLDHLKTVLPKKYGLDNSGLLLDIAAYIQAQENISIIFAFISSFVFKRSCWQHSESAKKWFDSNYIHLYQVHTALASTGSPIISHLKQPSIVARGNIANNITANVGEIMWLDARTLADVCCTIYGGQHSIQKAFGELFRRVYPIRTITSVLAQTLRPIDKKTTSALIYLGYSKFQLKMAKWLGKPYLRNLAIYFLTKK